jgi:hypothetical protein
MKKLLFTAIIISLAGVLSAEDAVQIPTPESTAMAVSTSTPAATAASTPDTQSNAGWQGYRLTLDADFTTVAMKRANDSITGYPPMTGFGGAFQAMLDFGAAVFPNLLLGGRAGYLFCIPASYEYDDGGAPNIHRKVSMDADLIPVEFGARLRFGIPFTTAGLSVGAYAGICVAMVTNNVNAVKTGKIANYVQSYYGLGFSGELSMALEFKLMKGVDFNVNGGYRIAGVPSVAQSTDASYTFSGESPVLASSKGDILRDASSVIIPFDYSGLHIGAGISIGY